MNKLKTSTLKLMNDKRKAVSIVSNLLGSADNDCLNTFTFFNMSNQKSKDDSLMQLNKIANDNLNNNIRLWLCQDQMDRDADTWTGILRCFGVTKKHINTLTKLGIVTSKPFFDDGSLFVDVNLNMVGDLVDGCFTDDTVTLVIKDFQDAMKKLQSKIDIFDGFHII
jgi:hypothetical protein